MSPEGERGRLFQAGFTRPRLVRGLRVMHPVECIITREHVSGQSLIRVSGALAQAHVADLVQACAAPERVSVIVDLADLVSADAVGVHSLRRLRADGVRLTNASQYIQSKLDW